jgi:hypothetical protein
MDINNLTIGQAKELAAMFGKNSSVSHGLNGMVGKKCIIRTYSAGVWFGEVSEKSGREVIIKNARRMWRWQAAESVSLSAVAVHGINVLKSKIAAPVESVWLEAIELIPATDKAIDLIEGAQHVKAE